MKDRLVDTGALVLGIVLVGIVGLVEMTRAAYVLVRRR